MQADGNLVLAKFLAMQYYHNDDKYNLDIINQPWLASDHGVHYAGTRFSVHEGAFLATNIL